MSEHDEHYRCGLYGQPEDTGGLWIDVATWVLIAVVAAVCVVAVVL